MKAIVLLQLCLTFLLLMNVAYGGPFDALMNYFGESQQEGDTDDGPISRFIKRGPSGVGPSSGPSGGRLFSAFQSQLSESQPGGGAGGPFVSAFLRRLSESQPGEGAGRELLNKLVGRGANGNRPNSDLSGEPFINALVSRLGESKQGGGADNGLISRLFQRGATGVGPDSALSDEEEEE
ncbi:uncharacterized protein LOC119164233 isoform X1 [Rhipicephalus microplus]|uniref:uncharacterized protein LOC119164233 isoform X1 n=1 Tax=Rhipicephalus microplus TaxID=6941 RepID=UPI003F6D11B5